jgi:hypothetical protein
MEASFFNNDNNNIIKNPFQTTILLDAEGWDVIIHIVADDWMTGQDDNFCRNHCSIYAHLPPVIGD